jgi:hypothetical protein
MNLLTKPDLLCPWPVRDLYLSCAEYAWLLDMHRRSICNEEYASYVVLVTFNLRPFTQYQVVIRD